VHSSPVSDVTVSPPAATASTTSALGAQRVIHAPVPTPTDVDFLLFHLFRAMKAPPSDADGTAASVLSPAPSQRPSVPPPPRTPVTPGSNSTSATLTPGGTVNQAHAGANSSGGSFLARAKGLADRWVNSAKSPAPAAVSSGSTPAPAGGGASSGGSGSLTRHDAIAVRQAAAQYAAQALQSIRYWNGIPTSACILARCLVHWDAFRTERQWILVHAVKELQQMFQEIYTHDDNLSFLLTNVIMLAHFVDGLKTASSAATPASSGVAIPAVAADSESKVQSIDKNPYEWMFGELRYVQTQVNDLNSPTIIIITHQPCCYTCSSNLSFACAACSATFTGVWV